MANIVGYKVQILKGKDWMDLTTIRAESFTSLDRCKEEAEKMMHKWQENYYTGQGLSPNLRVEPYQQL